MLTETRIRAVKPREKPYKLPDGRGLYLLVSPTGGRLWRLRYRYAGRESMLGLGAYPEVTLKAARERANDARKQLADGSDPAAVKRAERTAQADTFRAVALEWLGKQRFAAATREKTDWTFTELLFPFIGGKSVRQLTAPDILGVLRRLEARGKHETAHRTRQRVSQVMRYAISTGRAESDPTRDLRGALTPVVQRSHAAITDPVRVGELLRAIDGYIGDPATRAALKLAPLVFVRPGELRAAEWCEFNLEGAEWRIPAERMKMGEQHIVPLSRQALSILEQLRPITGHGRYLFPSLRTRERPISENTLGAALRRLGYSKDEMTAHGFRSTASTLLNEQGFAPDVIELQLAHAERNKVRAAYNRAQRLEERRRMMQAWADYLEGLKTGGNVVPIGRKRA
ncbi:MAG TPA: integrase arm-type DNA-binding domain-containing protein [Steroidobacteraceae bacterium]|nr:integrase arm-type DNA-binding domain-containing protein [Steroidobacteraceae bacterium]